MAPPAGTLRVGRYFAALLAILAVLYAIVLWPGARHTPKLGIDLAGGTEIIFTAKAPHGKQPSSSAMEQAKTIITDRVNGSGVTESTVQIQGNNQLVVSIPGQQEQDASKYGKAAVLNLRGLVAPGAIVNCTPKATASTSASPSATSSGTSTPSTSSSPSGTATSSTTPAGSKPSTSPTTAASGANAGARPLGKSTPTASASKTPTKAASTTPATSKTPTGTASKTPTGTATGSATPSASSTSTAPPPVCSTDALATVAKAGKFTIPTTDTAYNALSASNQQLIQAALANFDCSSGANETDTADKDFVACDSSGIAYLLGPVVVSGKQISTASAQAPTFGTGGSSVWTVNLTLSTGGGHSGLSAWAKYTSAHNFGSSTTNNTAAYQCSYAAARCANYVGFTLDGQVISIPQNETTINTNPTQISGSFTASSAKTLANQLKYGALPLSFTLQSSEPVSATLGSSQLKAGLLAGGIGLLLVVLYSLIYYRALGLVTVASLLVSGALTYGSLVMLATQIDFTLSLAGIAGFIVAVGITADSFVVFFERMKDEVHEGRSARVAIPRAWVRARRTILSADTVSFLAAAILYYFAAGDVRGFAFTLGLSTILDLVVVFLFTHPLISFLSRFEAFGSARFTGLDSIRGGQAVSEIAAAERAARPARSKPARAAGTAVLDQTAEPEADQPSVDAEPVDEAPIPEPTVVDTPDADAPDADTPDVGTPEVGTPDAETPDAEAADEAEPRRTAPEPGTAAERAAARRARLREEKNKGTNGKGTS